MEVRWKVLIAGVGAGAVCAAAVVVLRQPSARPAPAVDRVEPRTAIAVPLADAAPSAPIEQSLPGSWVDQAPPGADPKGPLILGLHGRGDTPEHFSGVAGRLGPRWTWRFLKAPLPWKENTQWFQREGKDLGRSDIAADLRMIEAHIRSAQGRKVALVGFSQGCFVAAHFVAEHPEQVAAVVCLSGALAHPLELPPVTAKPPVLLVHGTDDQIVPIAMARDAAAQLEKLGLPCEFQQHAEGHTIPDAEAARVREWLERKLGAAGPR